MSDEQTTPSAEERLSAFFNNEPAPEAEAPETTVEETPEAEQEPDGLLAEDVPDDESQAASQPDADGLDLVYNGEAERVDRKRATELAQRGLHLERAEQKVVGELQSAQQQASQIKQIVESISKTAPQITALQSQMHALNMIAQSENLNPQTIYQTSLTDPAKAQEMQSRLGVLQHQYNQAAAMLQQVSQQMEHERQTLTQSQIQAERQVLQRLLPQSKDPVKYEQIQADLKNMLPNLRPQTVEAIDGNAEIYAAFAAKAELDRLKASKREKLQTAGKAPQVVKPGAAPNPNASNRDRYVKQRAVLKKSGSVEDAARLLRMKMR